MKLLTLELSGIGPFAQCQYIDFERFTDSGLFLLRGSTGSGKTTLIDAIVFALYGDVASGSEGAKNRLRSSYCGPNDPSFVTLVFEVSSGIYRVHRTPKYMKEGRSTPVNPTLVLERVVRDSDDPSGFSTVEPLSRSIMDAQSMITTFIGLTKDQFLQTVVLPQGQFARFLTAKSIEREEILRDIFGTQFFQSLQDAFREQAKEAHDSIVHARQHAHASLDSLLDDVSHSHLGEEWAYTLHTLADSLDTFRPGSSVNTEFSHFRLRLDAQLEEDVQQADTARLLQKERSRQLSAELTKARDLNERLTERAQFLDHRDQLLERTQDIDAVRNSVAELRLLQPLELPLRQYDSAHEAREQAFGALAECFALLQDAPEDLQLDELQARLDERERNLQEQRESLTHALQAQAQLTRLRGEQEECLTQCEECTRSVEDADSQIQAAQMQGAQLRDQLEAARAAASALHDLEASCHHLSTRLDAAQRADRLREQLVHLKDDIQEATHLARQRGERSHAARELWLRETAASLASTLHEEDACPVCGSTTHPQPARFEGEESMSREQLETLEKATTAADKRLHELTTEHSTCSAQIAALDEQAQGDSASVKAQLNELTTRITALRSLADSEQSIHESLAECQENEKNLIATKASQTQRLSHLREENKDLLLRIDEETQEFTQLTRGHTSLEEWTSSLEDSTQAHQRSREVLQRYQHAEQRLREAQGFLMGALEDAGLSPDSSGIELLRSKLPLLSDLSAKVAILQEYDQDLFATRQALESDRLQGLEGQSPLDCHAIASSLEEAENALLTATDHVASIQAHRQGIERSLRNVENAFSALTSACESGYPKQRLAELASGTGPSLHQVPLSSWILMSRFEELIAAANPRLAEISHGRYELRRSDTDATRSRKNGLGLSILDHESEEERNPSTLSGGETFYVSLALALGLADVVMAESGGITLSSMFIDEGFGSLDLDTLDIVMSQLLALRESDRCIGVISHVDEMARQIPDQIEVRWREGEGSTLSIRAS